MGGVATKPPTPKTPSLPEPIPKPPKIRSEGTGRDAKSVDKVRVRVREKVKDKIKVNVKVIIKVKVKVKIKLK